MNYKKGDFHLHTTASDGKLSPEELVELAKDRGLDIIAVTDHDTTLGIDSALAAGERLNIRVLPGIELSTLHKGESIHILGIFRDLSYRNPKLQNYLEEMKNYRVIRARKMIVNLKLFFDIDVDYKRIYEAAKGVIARPHIARAIIEAGYDYSWDYIFDNIIGKNSPAYVPNKKITIEEGIKFLKSYNAITILAHPVLVRTSGLEELLECDFDGVEAVYPLNLPEETELYKAAALERNLLITAGSDFHGGDAGDTRHGILGEIYLDEDGIAQLLNTLEKNT